MIKFKIVTPEREVFADEVDSITLPTSQGEITVLPNHIPLVSNLIAGELIVRKGADVTPMAISGGFVEVRKGNEIIVLADTAERVHELDEARADEARKRAEKLLTERRVDDVDYAALASKIEKELARVRVARKYAHLRGRGPSIKSDE